MSETPADVVAFWREAGPERWFKKDTDFDEQIRARFLEDLVRGVELARTPSAWPAARRRVNGGLLSDHAPVEAEVTWT